LCSVLERQPASEIAQVPSRVKFLRMKPHKNEDETPHFETPQK